MYFTVCMYSNIGSNEKQFTNYKKTKVTKINKIIQHKIYNHDTEQESLALASMA